MLRCASSFVIAAYAKVRLIPQDSRALPAAFLRSRPIFMTFKTFYEVVLYDSLEKNLLVDPAGKVGKERTAFHDPDFMSGLLGKDQGRRSAPRRAGPSLRGRTAPKEESGDLRGPGPGPSRRSGYPS